MDTKQCTKCKETLGLEEFNRRSVSPDGLRTRCKACVAVENKEWRKANRPRLLVQKKARYTANKKQALEYQKEHYENNKAYILAQQKEYARANLDKINARVAKRHAARLQRTPKWLTKRDFALMENYYIKAKLLELETGVKHHVDHIIPLQGDLVSGLHVPSNLQVITAEENRSKSNTFVVE